MSQQADLPGVAGPQAGDPCGRFQLTATVPAFPGSVIEMTPPHVHIAVQPVCKAG